MLFRRFQLSRDIGIDLAGVAVAWALAHALAERRAPASGLTLVREAGELALPLEHDPEHDEDRKAA